MTTYLWFNVLEDISGLEHASDYSLVFVNKIHSKIYFSLNKKQKSWLCSIYSWEYFGG